MQDRDTTPRLEIIGSAARIVADAVEGGSCRAATTPIDELLALGLAALEVVYQRDLAYIGHFAPETTFDPALLRVREVLLEEAEISHHTERRKLRGELLAAVERAQRAGVERLIAPLEKAAYDETATLRLDQATLHADIAEKKARAASTRLRAEDAELQRALAKGEVERPHEEQMERLKLEDQAKERETTLALKRLEIEIKRIEKDAEIIKYMAQLEAQQKKSFSQDVQEKIDAINTANSLKVWVNAVADPKSPDYIADVEDQEAERERRNDIYEATLDGTLGLRKKR